MKLIYNTMENYINDIHETLMSFKKKNYASMSQDEEFLRENNYLTALAMKQILGGSVKSKILVVGYGKLTAQLEKVLTESEIHILNFNKNKVADIEKKYGERSYFEKVNLKDFPIVINTIPKQVLDAKMFSKKTKVYELASAPYGVSGDVSKIDYTILPALPGKHFPKQATQAVINAMGRAIDGQESKKKSIVLCVTGSSCSYLRLLPTVSELVKSYDIIPVLSGNANLPNRFCDIEKFRNDLREICGHNVITTIAGAETLSANKDVVASVVLPATGNTVAKLAVAATDTCVTMAVKALLRNSKPCIIGISTNDALSGNASNIGMLLNRKNYYFVPFGQDAPEQKPFSLVCDFARVGETIEAALCGKQLQPIVF